MPTTDYADLVNLRVREDLDDVCCSLSGMRADQRTFDRLSDSLGPGRTARALARAAAIVARSPRLCSGAPNPDYRPTKKPR